MPPEIEQRPIQLQYVLAQIASIGPLRRGIITSGPLRIAAQGRGWQRPIWTRLRRTQFAFAPAWHPLLTKGPAVKVTIFHNGPRQCASCGLPRHCLRWPGSAALPCYGWRVPVGARFFALPIVPRWPLPSRTQDLLAQDRFRKTFKKRNFSSSRAKTSWRVGAKTAPILEFPPASGAKGEVRKGGEPPRRKPLNARRKGDRYARHLDLTAPDPEARRTPSRGGLPAFPPTKGDQP